VRHGNYKHHQYVTPDRVGSESMLTCTPVTIIVGILTVISLGQALIALSGVYTSYAAGEITAMAALKAAAVIAFDFALAQVGLSTRLIGKLFGETLVVGSAEASTAGIEAIEAGILEGTQSAERLASALYREARSLSTIQEVSETSSSVNVVVHEVSEASSMSSLNLPGTVVQEVAGPGSIYLPGTVQPGTVIHLPGARVQEVAGPGSISSLNLMDGTGTGSTRPLLSIMARSRRFYRYLRNMFHRGPPKHGKPELVQDARPAGGRQPSQWLREPGLRHSGPPRARVEEIRPDGERVPMQQSERTWEVDPLIPDFVRPDLFPSHPDGPLTNAPPSSWELDENLDAFITRDGEMVRKSGAQSQLR
jgi:hypothetical protein